jgi:hypothetical protein
MSALLVQDVPPQKCLKYRFSTTSLHRTQDSPPQWPSSILDDVLPHPPYNPSLRASWCVMLGGGQGSRWGDLYTTDETLQNAMRQWLQWDSNVCLAPIHAYFENGRKLSTKAETRMKITTSPAMLYGRSVKMSHVTNPCVAYLGLLVGNKVK